MTAENKADLWYTDYYRLLNRQGYMKKKLMSMFDLTDEQQALSEIEIMHSMGFDVIYGPGTKTWVLQR